jgi:hypothetical protein
MRPYLVITYFRHGIEWYSIQGSLIRIFGKLSQLTTY